MSGTTLIGVDVSVMEQGRVVLEGRSADVAASEHVQHAYLGAL